MSLLSAIKRGSSILLLICFFLPLSQCKQIASPENPVVVSQTYSASSTYEWPSIGSSVALFLFSWPAIGQVIALRRQAYLSLRVVIVVEIVLSLLTLLGITWLVFWGSKIQYGAFIAYGATVAYLGATLWAHLSKRPNPAFERDSAKARSPSTKR